MAYMQTIAKNISKRNPQGYHVVKTDNILAYFFFLQD